VCVLSGRRLCDGLVTRSEESYQVWCVCDLETSKRRPPRPNLGCCATGKERSRTHLLNSKPFSNVCGRKKTWQSSIKSIHQKSSLHPVPGVGRIQET
jgi:hypothetical protein